MIDVRFGSKADIRRLRLFVRIVPTADIAPDDPLERCSSREGPVLEMSRRAEHHRGYAIDGNMQARGWSVELHSKHPI
jgi:hypothetical protein